MSADADLEAIAAAMKTLEGRFRSAQSLGLYLELDDESEFKRLAVEGKAILDAALGRLNDFSVNLINAINAGSGGYLGGPSLASVRSARALIEGGINQIRRSHTLTQSVKPTTGSAPYVDSSRLAQLRALLSRHWDLRRLIRLLEELNNASDHECHISTAMLVRAIADHVPPIFGKRTFTEVADHHGGGSSFRRSMQHLNSSMRNIADAHLHVQIRRSEVLPSRTQVNFQADLDVLIGEVIRLVRDAEHASDAPVR